MLYAHTPNDDGEWDSLLRHLRDVATNAACFARPFGGEHVACWAGLLHDVGKASKEFQTYLERCALDPKHRERVDHKGAGTFLGRRIFDHLPHLIDGHHGGLSDGGEITATLNDLSRPERRSEIGVAFADIQGEGLFADGIAPSVPPAHPSFVETATTTRELFLRMVFSALVDADHADTERHFHKEKAALREHIPSVDDLLKRLLEDQDRLIAEAKPSLVNEIRREVYEACLREAARPPGFYRLTVPTGGGKTRSVLAFALKHAELHELERVIVAVPYLTITEQTANEYRKIFRDDRAVLEHHSGVTEPPDGGGRQDPGAVWQRLAAQDWNARVVVTTTVQLFESLFGRTPTACRKLHRLAKSVIVLDEVQTLPPHLRGPIYDALRDLVTHFGASVVLCTATQPALDTLPELADGVEQIVSEPDRLFRALDRVRYEWPALTEQWSWDRVAEEMWRSGQCLAVVNTIASAQALFGALGDEDAYHLSTLLCGAHRRDVLALIRKRLDDPSEPCRVVSTQLIEAGVDIDFPAVLRAMGPLDRIVQAAGRCNRNGRPERGKVIVFDPIDGGMPQGAYQAATGATLTMLREGDLDLNHPETFIAYFRRFYGQWPADKKNIQLLRRDLAFEKVATSFQMIEEESVSVFVRYEGLPGVKSEHARRSNALLSELHRAAEGQSHQPARELLRQAQPYLVSVRERRIREYARENPPLAVELLPGVWEWKGGYDEKRGLRDDRLDVTTLYVGA